MANLSNIKIKLLNKDIASIIINEPKTYNALSLKNLGDLIKAFKKLDENKNIKVIIIEGSGKGFSAGHNLKEVSGLKKREKYQKLFNLCSKLMLQIVEGKKPVIAKVHGAAFAAGCQLVASCDLAYSTKDALFATPGVNIGLFCSTPMVAVSRKVNRKRMMQMLLTGEPSYQEHDLRSAKSLFHHLTLQLFRGPSSETSTRGVMLPSTRTLRRNKLLESLELSPN